MRLIIPGDHERTSMACERQPSAQAGYAYAVAHRPASVHTGDYYDLFHLEDGCLAVFVGDAAGHGAVAGRLASAMMGILRTHPELHGDPGKALTAANRMFHLVTRPDRFLTGVYVLLEEGGRVGWASAGHDPPLRVRATGVVESVDLSAVGFPLGIDPHEEYQTAPRHLHPGDRLILFTDGLVEVSGEDGEPFGRSRLAALAGELIDLPLAEMVNELIARATACRQGQELEDDVTVLGVERPA
jgi:sigma-B regulation protein RsbU (phosphoserine phosphatase)